MVTKLCGLVNRYWHVVCYLFFGGLTTLVNWIVYYGLLLLNVNAELANLLAFVAGVCFAFATERKTAFESRSKGKEVAQEAWKFLLGRLGVWGIEQILLTVGLHALMSPEDTAPEEHEPPEEGAVLNFIFGRLVVFRKGSGRARAKQKQS